MLGYVYTGHGLHEYREIISNNFLFLEYLSDNLEGVFRSFFLSFFLFRELEFHDLDVLRKAIRRLRIRSD